MKVQIIANGKVSLVISPENSMEEESLKQLMKQSNEIVEIRNGLTVLQQQYNTGLVIQSKTATQVTKTVEKDHSEPDKTPAQSDED